MEFLNHACMRCHWAALAWPFWRVQSKHLIENPLFYLIIKLMSLISFIQPFDGSQANALNCLEWFRTLVAFSGPLLSRPATITFPFSWHLLSRTTWPALIEEQYRTMATMGAFYVSYVLHRMLSYSNTTMFN